MTKSSAASSPTSSSLASSSSASSKPTTTSSVGMDDQAEPHGFVSDPVPVIHEPRRHYNNTSGSRFNHLQLSNTLMCGALAGIAAKTVIAPIERVKMSFQVTSERFTLRGALNRGLQTIRQEGFFSLWKGHSTTVIRVAPYAALSYTFHDISEDFFKASLQQETLPPALKFAAGSIGGLAGTLLTYPLDVLRVRIALGGSWQSSLRQGGLMQGLGPTLLGIVPYAGTSWMAKQTLFEAYMHAYPSSRYPGGPSIVESLCINALAGLLGQFVTYPLDILRRRMQIAQPNQASGKYLTLREVLKQLWRDEGLRGLGKGFSLNIFKGPLSLSVSLTVYDILRKEVFFEDVEGSRKGSARGGGSTSIHNTRGDGSNDNDRVNDGNSNKADGYSGSFSGRNGETSSTAVLASSSSSSAAVVSSKRHDSSS